MGRYERNEVLSSIEIARKIADILDVSLDYLTGKVDVEMDKTTRKRILEVSNTKLTLRCRINIGKLKCNMCVILQLIWYKFDEDDKLHIFSVIDAFIAKRKIQAIL